LESDSVGVHVTGNTAGQGSSKEEKNSAGLLANGYGIQDAAEDLQRFPALFTANHSLAQGTVVLSSEPVSRPHER